MNEPLDEEAPMTGEGALTLPQTESLRTEDIRRGRRGVEEVVTDLYGKLRAPLVSYVYHLVNSTRDAEDVVQVAFLQLFDQLEHDGDIENVRGWLYRVVHNLAIDHVRQHGRRSSLLQQWLADRGAFYPTIAYTPPAVLCTRIGPVGLSTNVHFDSDNLTGTFLRSTICKNMQMRISAYWKIREAK